MITPIVAVYCGCGRVMESPTLYSHGDIHSLTVSCDVCGVHVDIDFDNRVELPTRLEGSQ